MKDFQIIINSQIFDLYKFLKASNRLYNEALYNSIKFNKKMRSLLKRNKDITLYPAKLEYDYYNSIIINDTQKIFMLSKKQKIEICTYLLNTLKDDDSSSHLSKLKPYLLNRLSDTIIKHDNRHYLKTGWNDEWHIIFNTIQTLIDGFYVLGKSKDPILFKREPYKKTAINSIYHVLELAQHKHDINLNNSLNKLKDEISKAPFISEKKIYKSIYIQLVIQLTNYNESGLSRTYSAKEVAQDIMKDVFNKKVDYSIPKNITNLKRTLHYGVFSLYDS